MEDVLAASPDLPVCWGDGRRGCGAPECPKLAVGGHVILGCLPVFVLITHFLDWPFEVMPLHFIVRWLWPL